MNKSDLKSDLPFLYKTGIAELFTRSIYSMKTVNFQKRKINYLVCNIIMTWQPASKKSEFYELEIKLVKKIL